MPAAPRLTGRARAARGALAAGVAVGTAVLAHAAAHQAPSTTAVLLSLLVSLPICIGLADVRLSRTRLALSVGLSQALLHGLFILAPALPAVGAGDGHHAAPTAAVEGAAPQAAGHMLPAHALAAAGTYLLLRRGDVLVAALIDLLTLGPARILMGAVGGILPVAARCSVPRTARRPVLFRVDAEPGTVRGPPPHPPTPT